MGVLRDTVGEGAPNRGGFPNQLPNLLAALPPDAQDDLRALFDDHTKAIPEIRRAVMDLYPDAPVHAESTWFRWARMWRRDGVKY